MSDEQANKVLLPYLKRKVLKLRAVQHAPCQNGNRLNAAMKKPYKQLLRRNAGDPEKLGQ